VLCAAHALTHEIYYTAIALSVCVAGVGLWLAATMAGPLWDCDRCAGAYDVNSADPNGWLPTGSAVNFFTYGWWSSLFAASAFEEQYWARWEELPTLELAEGSHRGEVAKLREWLSARVTWAKANLRKR
jgi:hypothetical protein